MYVCVCVCKLKSYIIVFKLEEKQQKCVCWADLVMKGCSTVWEHQEKELHHLCFLIQTLELSRAADWLISLHWQACERFKAFDT